MHLSRRNVSLRDVVTQLNFEGIAKIIGSRNKNFFLFDLLRKLTPVSLYNSLTDLTQKKLANIFVRFHACRDKI